MAQLLTITTKSSILDVAAVLDPPLTTWLNAKESDELQVPIETITIQSKLILMHEQYELKTIILISRKQLSISLEKCIFLH